MAHGALKRPLVSVIMTARDAEATITRAVESVLGQDFDDVQLILTVLPSRDRTLSMCERWAERDFRCDVIACEADDELAACDAGCDAARGSYVMFMRQCDWLGAHALARLAQMAREHDLELAATVLAHDAVDGHGVRKSHVDASESGVFITAREVRERAYRFIERDAFDVLQGKMLKRERLVDLGLRMVLARSAEAYLVTYIEDITRLGIAADAIYHLNTAEVRRDEFDGELYERCERDHERLLELAVHWGMEHDEHLMQAIHRRHLRRLIACIENACARREVSSIERSARVRDILEAPSTQETIAALRSAHRIHREFGFMYEHIARKNVLACCVGVRMQGMMRLPALLAPRRKAAVL